MIITAEFLESISNNGIYNKRQITLLGLSYPLPKGWKEMLVGRPISDKNYYALMDERYKTGHKSAPIVTDFRSLVTFKMDGGLQKTMSIQDLIDFFNEYSGEE